MKKATILFLLVLGSMLNGQDIGMWSSGSFGGPVSYGFPSGDDIYFSQGTKLHKGIEGLENIEIVSTSSLRDAAIQIKINGDNLYCIYGPNSEYKNQITSTTLSNLGSSSSSQYSGIDNGINKFDEIDGFGLLAHNKDGILNDKLVGKDLLGNTNDSFEYIKDFKDFTINGYFAYLITDDGTTDNIIEVVDFTAKSSAQKVGSIIVKHAQSLYYSDGYLYVACENGEGLKTIDVSTPTSPILAGEYDANSFTQVIVDGATAYLRKNNVLTILNVSDPAIPAYVNVKTLDNITASVKFTDVKNSKIYYLDNGIFGIIDAGTLTISQKYLSALTSDWVASDNTTLVVYDKASYYFHSLENTYNPKAYAVLTAEVEPVDFIINGTDFFVTTNSKLYIHDTENLSAQSTEFTYFGEYSALKIANDIAVVGEYKYEGSVKFYYFEIIDLSDKNNPTQLHLAEYPTVGTITSIEISADNNTLYLASELEGKIWLAIFDIANKSAPTRVYADKLETITSNTIDGKNTKLGINGTELFVVTNYLTLNSYYAAKVFAYSVEESSNPRLISGLQITESEYNNVVFLEEMLFVTIPNDQAIRMYSLEGDSTFRKEWTQIKTLDLGDEPANLAVFVNKEVPASAVDGKFKFGETTDEVYRTGTLYKSKKEKGTEIIYVKVKPKIKVQLTTSVLPTEAGSGGCKVSPTDGEYDKNSVASITATAGTGWVFDTWTGGATPVSSPNASVTMTTDKNVIANFKPTLTLGFTSVDAENICPPTNTEKVYIGTTSLTAGGVDWQLKHLDYLVTTKVKAEYAGVFIKYNDKKVQGTIHKDDDGYMTGLNFAISHLLPKSNPQTFLLYFVFDFPPNEKGSLAPLSEIKRLAVSINRTQVNADPVIAIEGIKVPQDNFVSNIKTIGWIWNTSLSPHEPFVTIQDANDDPRTKDMDTIKICEGYYKYDSDIVINKGVTIEARSEGDEVFIEGNRDVLFDIAASNVVLKGLILENINEGEDDIVYNQTRCILVNKNYGSIKIIGNKIICNEYQIGVYLRNYNVACMLSKNRFVHKKKNFYNSTAIRIMQNHADEFLSNKIQDNEFNSFRKAVWLESHNNTEINKNIFINNENDVFLWNTDKTSIIKNSLNRILVDSSSNCKIDSNFSNSDNLFISSIKSSNLKILNSYTKDETKKVIIDIEKSLVKEIIANKNVKLMINSSLSRTEPFGVTNIKDNTFNEVYMSSFSNVKFTFNYFTKNGIELLSCQDVNFSINNFADIEGLGVSLVRCSRITLNYNTFWQIKSDGIKTIDGKNIYLLANKFTKIGGYGCNSNGTRLIEITDKNEFEYVEKGAIYLSECHGQTTIKNNIIKNSRTVHKKSIGIDIDYTWGNVAILLNKITGTKIGVDLFGAYGDNVVSSNKFYDNGEAIKTVFGSVFMNGNDIYDAKIGVSIYKAKKGNIKFNNFKRNGTAIVAQYSDNVIISKNYIENSTDDFTGIHLDNTIATIEDNNLTGNNGAAIGLFNNSGAKISGNNIYDNPNLAVYSDNSTNAVNVDGNYWGSTDEPSSDIFEGNIEYTNWLTEPISLIVDITEDSVKTPSGNTDSVFIAIGNYAIDNDNVELEIDDEKGWLTNGGTQTMNLNDSSFTFYDLKFSVPSDAGSSFNNKVTISAVSLTNSEMTAVDSFYILNYTPELALIRVDPDSIAVSLGDSLQFRAYATDQYEKEFSGATNYAWSVSAGTIDSSGYFRADSTQQVVTITATETNSNMTAISNINVQLHTDIAVTITIYPDSIVVPINGEVQFYAEGKDANGFNVVFNKFWVSSGGTIDSTGFYTAGDIVGEYHVLVADQHRGAGATAKVIIGTPTSVEEERIIPKEYSLNQNYPNPFNPSTTISYALPFESKVKVEIFNVLGQRVDMIANGVESAGVHSTLWDATHLASGIYIIRINATSVGSNAKFSKAMKMLLIK